jgi:uncharacterized protein
VANQLRILELLETEDHSKDDLKQKREMIEKGYTLAYDEVAENIWPEMPETACREVMDILDMYRILQVSYEKLEDKTGINPEGIRFQGFDGNHESQQLGYAEFLTKVQGRWDELQNDVYNNHGKMSIQNYRAMLTTFHRIDEALALTKEQIVQIVNSKP